MNQDILPGLYLVSTPLGNMEDCSDRMKRYLDQVDLIACEDTREMKKMLSILGIERNPKDIFSIHEHNEMQMADKVVDLIREGKSVAYASDAGMPGISDPGQILVDKVFDENLFLTSIPGATAVTTAISLSGFTNTGFSFLGFFPRSKKEQDHVFEFVKKSLHPIAFYESPKRLSTTLSLLDSILGSSRRALVCRELTKKFEQISRSSLGDLKVEFSGENKGECVIVIEPDSQKSQNSKEVDTENIESTLKVLKAAGVSSKDAVQALSFITDVPKNKLKELFLNSSSS